MLNFQLRPSDLEFSAKISSTRLKKATALIGEKAIKRIIGLALFLLGANRKQISEMLDLPLGTFFTFLTRFHKFGTGVFLTKVPAKKVEQPALLSNVIYEHCGIQTRLKFPESPLRLTIHEGNRLQHKASILSFFRWGLMSCTDAAEHLGVTERHVRDLAQKLEADDLEGLLDKRQGQKQDYSFTSRVKAELVQQFSFNIVTGKTASSQQICKQVNEACDTHLSDRSIRLHMNKLGLPEIKESLLKMVEEFKKNSPD